MLSQSQLLLAACLLLSGSALADLQGQKRPLTEQELKSDEFRGALDAATIEMNRISNSANFHAAIGVTTATKQLVSGTLYDFSAQFEETKCENREELLLQNIASCQPEGDSHELRFSCGFQVLHQPWLAGSEYRVVSEANCQHVRQQPRLQAGGKQPLTPEEIRSHEFAGALQAAQDEFNTNSYLPNLHLIASTGFATKQIVAGVLYEFSSELVETQCENQQHNYGKDLGQCRPTNRQPSFVCKHRILYQAWTSQHYTVLGDRNCSVKI